MAHRNPNSGMLPQDDGPSPFEQQLAHLMSQHQHMHRPQAQGYQPPPPMHAQAMHTGSLSDLYAAPLPPASGPPGDMAYASHHDHYGQNAQQTAALLAAQQQSNAMIAASIAAQMRSLDHRLDPMRADRPVDSFMPFPTATQLPSAVPQPTHTRTLGPAALAASAVSSGTSSGASSGAAVSAASPAKPKVTVTKYERDRDINFRADVEAIREQYPQGPWDKLDIDEVTSRRQAFYSMTREQRDYFLFGMLSVLDGGDTTRSRRLRNAKRKNMHTFYCFDHNTPISRDLFLAIYGISKKYLDNLRKQMKEKGLKARDTSGASSSASAAANGGASSSGANGGGASSSGSAVSGNVSGGASSSAVPSLMRANGPDATGGVSSSTSGGPSSSAGSDESGSSATAPPPPMLFPSVVPSVQGSRK